MKATRRYSVNAIGGTSVTLSPMTMNEDDGKAGQPNLLGSGNIVVTQGATPAAAFWKVARRYKVTVEVVDG